MGIEGLYIGRNGIELGVLEEHTGLRFLRAERERLLISLRDLMPRIVLLGAEGDRTTLRDGVGLVRSVCDAPLLALVGNEGGGTEALRSGADSILAAPPNPEELGLKVSILLRNCGPGRPPIYSDEALVLDRMRGRAVVGGEEISLTPTEFRMLSVLIDRGDAVIGHLELRDLVWGDRFHDRSEVKLYVSYLRRKFEPVGLDPIETIRGVGYRYCPRPLDR